MKDFAGRTAFVTGGAHGIGIGLVRALLGAGLQRRASPTSAPTPSTRRSQALDNPRAMGVQVDVSSREAMARAADQVEAKFGAVSLLFNNAGVNLFQTIEESSYDDWDWVMGVNLQGPINGVMTFVPRMIAAAQGHGYVVNTASMAALPGRRRARHLQHHQVRRARHVRIAAREPRAARHRRLGAVPGAGQVLYLRERRDPAGRPQGRRQAGRHARP